MAVVRLFLVLLLTLACAAGAAHAARPVLIAAPSAQELFDAGGCRGCHSLGDRGGSRGAALDKVGKRLDAGRLRLWLLWPQSLAPGTSMPVYDHLSEEQIELLVDYLAGLK